MTETKALAMRSSGAADLPDLIQRCDRENPVREDVDKLRQLLSQPDIWRASHLSHTTALEAIEKTNSTQGTRAILRASYSGLCQDLGITDAPPLEKALISHVALCWLRLQVIEKQYSGMQAGSMTLSQGDYWERRLSAAQRRYLRAVETLARVRRLRVPALQVNIGEKQINIAK